MFNVWNVQASKSPLKIMFKKIITNLKKLIGRIRNPHYQVIYAPASRPGETLRYVVTPCKKKNEFDNMANQEKNCGFRAFCILPRKAVRSFRYDSIISMNKLGVFEEW